jgi:hypothetical protein
MKNIFVILVMMAYLTLLSAGINDVWKDVRAGELTGFSGVLLILVLVYFLLAGLVKIASYYEGEPENLTDEI